MAKDPPTLLHQLQERVKELGALHAAGRLLGAPDLPVPELLRRFVRIIPPALQFPEVAIARVRYAGHDVSTGTAHGTWHLVVSFRTSDGNTGELVASYTEERPEADDGPFLREERDLLGSLAEMLTTALDRRGTLATLQASEQRFREMAEHVGEVFYNYDVATNRLLYVNEAFERIWGRPIGEILADPTRYLDHVHPDDRMRAEGAFARQLAGAETTETFRVVRPDGTARWVMEHAVPVRGADGTVERLVGTIRDVTPLKEAEEQLLRAQRLESLGTLAGGIAHDLNNVLGPIVLALDRLREAVATPEDRALVALLDASARRGADLVRQVLLFARGTTGRHALHDPAALLAEGRAFLQEVLPRNVALAVEVPDGLWPIAGDATQLQQVLMNLVLNARDAMPEGGTLAVALANVTLPAGNPPPGAVGTPGTGPHVRLEVRDSGGGIPAEVRERIFDPFFTTKEVGKGTGLGLATTLAIIRQHGGFLQVEDAPGGGTILRAHVPARPGADVPPPIAAEPTVLDGRGELVLVVDDEPAIRSVACRVLEHHGYRTVAAADGVEAFAAWQAAREAVRVVLTDLAMPAMDGPALIRAIRAEDRDLPILACTGVSEGEMVEAARAAGADHLLPKPFTAGELLLAVGTAVRGTGGEGGGGEGDKR